MQAWTQRTIIYIGCAMLFCGLIACRRATVTQQSTAVNAAAKPAPQPSVCQAENLSRSALLQQASASNELRVLFIGNSLTYTNNLPELVAALAAAAGQKPLNFQALVGGGFALEDHWNSDKARKLITAGGWQYVVLQQGPSALPESRKLLLDYTRRFAQEIRRSGARPALYMVWPSRARAQDFGGVSESYQLAAQEVDGLLFPAGEAWQSAWRRDPKLELYSPDGLHPTLAGTYLAALVIYQQLYKPSSFDFTQPLRWRNGKEIKLGLKPEQLKLLQEAATEANQRFARP
jgi:hypothetical protein